MKSFIYKLLGIDKNETLYPDKPIGFGYKTDWFAIKSQDNKVVAEFLKISNIKVSNWKSGVEYGYKKGTFITPSIDGWVLVLGIDIFDFPDIGIFLSRLSEKFEECQVFYNYRITDQYLWALAKDGKLVRFYSYFESKTEENIGELSSIEKSIDWFNIPEDKLEDEIFLEQSDIDFPTEEMVMKVAENWSINPTKIEEYFDIESFGLTGIWNIKNKIT